MASADLEVTSRIELETLAIVRPGDTLVVGWPETRLSRQQADEIVAHVAKRLPGVEVVVVPARQFAVYRPDGA